MVIVNKKMVKRECLHISLTSTQHVHIIHTYHRAKNTQADEQSINDEIATEVLFYKEKYR